MRNNRLRVLLALAIAMLAFSSCRKTKDLVYLQNLPDGELVPTQTFSTDNYQLRQGDNLYIQVVSINPEVNQLFNPSMSGNNSNSAQQYNSVSGQYLNGYQIDLEGQVELPIIGLVKVEGKTLVEAKQALAKKVSEYFKDATLTVKLMNFRVTVMGEVSNPGVIYAYNNTCTLLEAISQAGGTTDYSQLQKALVVRQTEKGSKNIAVDLTDKGFMSSEAYYLHPNDVVYVVPDRYKNARLNAPLYTLMLSSLSTLILILNYIN